MNLNKLTKIVAVAALGGVPLTGAQAQEDPIKIGFAIAQSGWLSNYDLSPYRAAVAKIDQINASGGLLGRQIEYTVGDTKTEQERAAAVGAQMVSTGVDLLVVSCDYDFGAPAALAANSAGIITMSLCAADPKMGVQGVGPYAFSGNSAAQSEGIAIAEYGVKKMGLKTAYVLEDTTIEYNKSNCAGFRHAWKETAGEGSIVGEDSFRNEDPSIAAQITRIKSLDVAPDAIHICSFTPGGASAVRQLRAAGIDAPILASTAMVDNYWLNAVPGLKDFYVPGFMSLYGDDPRPEMAEFLAAFNERWGEGPVSSYSVLGYTLIESWAHAVEQAETADADEVLSVMNSYVDEPFTAGLTSFSDQLHIQTNRPWLIMKVEDDTFKAVEIFRNTITPDMRLLFRVGQ
ncbi:ABC transporter substrate-binding protein [Roseovarius sp. ZX-A-9]|uniref:ABC transporter substrate-binding protein n=1 Tax=Roseovarius sp. ZX-A-9 TaxID=3014783 RepID=UPI00232F244F|nr:ABC transporter substrate-binding protein [Roseovarius sp. ZX-A-9]